VVAVVPVPSCRTHSALLAAPSDDVVDSAEVVVCLENEVKSLGPRRQKEEQLDWFRERENRDVEREIQRREAEQMQQAQLSGRYVACRTQLRVYPVALWPDFRTSEPLLRVTLILFVDKKLPAPARNPFVGQLLARILEQSVKPLSRHFTPRLQPFAEFLS
jgi:hypothetical protein